MTGISAGVFGRTSRSLAIALSALQAMLTVLMLASLNTVGPLVVIGFAFNAPWCGRASWSACGPCRAAPWSWPGSRPFP